MEMEVKVDVHTVYPSSSKTETTCPQKTTVKDSRSWGTPDSTPSRPPLTKTTSNIETQTYKREDEDVSDRKGTIFTIENRVSLFERFPRPKNENTSPSTELQSFEKFTRSSLRRKSKPDDLSIEEILSIQSPVPEIPVEKERKHLKLPTLCDPHIPIDPQVTFCYGYNAWCVVLRATFPYQTPENLPLWMTLDYFCDLVYLFDVAFVKPRLMFLNEGFWVTDQVETRKNYKKTKQYKFDVISLLPLDVLYLYFGTKLVILRLPRLLKLQTFWEFHQTMDRVLSSPYVVRIGKTLFYIFYLIHLNACAYYAVSKYIGLGSNSWVYDNEGIAYIRKNPKPVYSWEYLYMTVAWLMGVRNTDRR
ncbi:unnamed protein product [Leptidea sinapis]|uniref:Ion transport domain-containing protein n=1 Tax=Leptidea sinapis TaxID=189913 RepID=A0A5E4QLK0_9NEOP|nr:unnamed protein product [Leptidea sinapis]